VFFLSPEGDKVYARYGQRNGKSADALQSLKGLRHTMESVLTMHASEKKAFAPRNGERSFTMSDAGGRARRCYHCHNVNEALNRKFLSPFYYLI